MGKEVILEIKNLEKSFGKKEVLKDLNLKVKKGEILGLLGPSGQGKSVLIKIIINFLKATSGQIILNTSRDKINFSMQNNSIYDSLTVKQNWIYFSKINGIKRSFRKKQIKELLTHLHIEEYKNTIVRNLSGGTKKRVDIGAALLNDPDILILDEPFTGLDQKLVEHLAKYILYLNEQGKTIIITSHRVKLMSRLCSRLVLLKDKKIKEVPKNKIWEEYEDLE